LFQHVRANEFTRCDIHVAAASLDRDVAVVLLLLLLLLLLPLVNIYYATVCRQVQNLANRILAILCILIAERQ